MPNRCGFTAFSDLIFNKLVASCPNRQLDTVVAIYLKDKVVSVEKLDSTLKVIVASSEMFKFIPGMCFRFFKQNLATKTLIMLGDANLVSSNCEDGKLCLCFPPDTELGDVDTPSKYSPMYISPGKTHGGISRFDQLLWQTEDHVVKTMFYCFIDVVLTLFLAACVKSGPEMSSATVLKLPPFTEVDLRSRAGLKIQILHAELFRNAGTFQAKIVTPSQVLLFNRALEIEGVRREDSINYTGSEVRLAHYPLIESFNNRSLKETMEMSFENVAEAHLGTMFLVDATNKKNVQDNLNAIIHLI